MQPNYFTADVIDLEAYDEVAEKGKLFTGDWDGDESQGACCGLSAAVGPSQSACEEVGMPSWLIYLYVSVFDYATDGDWAAQASEQSTRIGRDLLKAFIKGANSSVDWACIRVDIYNKVLLPVLLELIKDFPQSLKVLQQKGDHVPDELVKDAVQDGEDLTAVLTRWQDRDYVFNFELCAEFQQLKQDITRRWRPYPDVPSQKKFIGCALDDDLHPVIALSHSLVGAAETKKLAQHVSDELIKIIDNHAN